MLSIPLQNIKTIVLQSYKVRIFAYDVLFKIKPLKIRMITISTIKRILIITLLMLLPMQTLIAEGEVDIKSIKVSAEKKYLYHVNGTVSFQLSDTLQRALIQGVKLNATINYTLGKHRWWWNSARLISKTSYQLKYHSLTKHYVLKNTKNDQQWSFSNLPSALKQMGKIENHPLPLLPTAIDSGDYYLFIRAKIGITSSSLPLKVQSYFKSSKNHIKSEGILWALP